MNMKTYCVRISLVLILVLASTGCSKTEPVQIVLEQPGIITEEMTEEVSEEGIEEESSSSQVETENVLGNDGSVSIISKDSEEKVVAKINYDASTNITEKYIYEYDENGNLRSELKYTAEGNVVNQFMEDDYELTGEPEIKSIIPDNITENLVGNTKRILYDVLDGKTPDANVCNVTRDIILIGTFFIRNFLHYLFLLFLSPLYSPLLYFLSLVLEHHQVFSYKYQW